jgi:hypothetical protein
MELSNIVWAISTTRTVMLPGVAQVLDDAVVTACVRFPRTFSTQSVANILWAAGNTPQLFPLSTRALDELAKMTYSKFPDFTTQGLANTLWGFASSNYNPGEGLFSEIKRAWTEKGDRYSVIELNNMLWAMHTLKENPGPRVFSIVHSRVARLCDEDAEKESAEMTFNHLANFMYHMAQYEELPDPQTMVRVEETLLRKIASRGGEILSFPRRKFRERKPDNDARRSVSDVPPPATFDRPYQGIESLRKHGDVCGTYEVGEGVTISTEAIRKACANIQPHVVANTLWAFSVLKYKPGAALTNVFDDMVFAYSKDFSDQSLSMTVFACANLAIDPKPETLRALMEECEGRIERDGFTAQGLSNTFWAWSVMGIQTPRLFRAYSKRFAEMADAAGFDNSLSRVDLVQIYQASLALEHCAEKDGALECDADFSGKDSKDEGDAFPLGSQLLKGALLTRAREVWEQTSTGRVTVSSLHRVVSETLTFMGIPHEIEMVADDNFSLDIALRGRQIAIEVDGPSHFFANRPSTYVGADRLRTKVLKAKGWTVRARFFFFFFSF